MIGLSTIGSISFGCAFVAGRKRVPSPAAGKTALRTLASILYSLFREDAEPQGRKGLAWGNCRRKHPFESTWGCGKSDLSFPWGVWYELGPRKITHGLRN